MESGARKMAFNLLLIILSVIDTSLLATRSPLQ